MSEALISRGFFDTASISNETKQAIGLSNNASLDDCLSALALKDDNYATIICTLLEPDGNVVTDGTISMIDGIGTQINYKTNNIGKCMFKTNTGQAIFSEINCKYIDINSPKNIVVDAVIGTISYLTLKRDIYGNGYNAPIIENNRSVYFSKFMNTVDITVCGGGGASGAGFIKDVKINISSNGLSTTVSLNNYINGGRGGNGYYNYFNNYNIIPDFNYNAIIGRGGYALPRTTAIIDNYGYRTNGASISWSDTIRQKASRITANSGGTTSFDSVIYASGGLGGKGGGEINGEDGIGESTVLKNPYSGGAGVFKPNISNAKILNKYTSEETVRVSYNYGVEGISGNSGCIMLNNFQYK